MGPSCKRKTRQSGKKATTVCNNNKQVKCDETHDAIESPTVPASPMKNDDGVIVVDSTCTTPKAEKYRIPEINTCPPAPKKRRIRSNFQLRGSHLSFIAPADLEFFFLVGPS